MNNQLWKHDACTTKHSSDWSRRLMAAQAQSAGQCSWWNRLCRILIDDPGAIIANPDILANAIDVLETSQDREAEVKELTKLLNAIDRERAKSESQRGQTIRSAG